MQMQMKSMLKAVFITFVTSANFLIDKLGLLRIGSTNAVKELNRRPFLIVVKIGENPIQIYNISSLTQVTIIYGLHLKPSLK